MSCALSLSGVAYTTHTKGLLVAEIVVGFIAECISRARDAHTPDWPQAHIHAHTTSPPLIYS
jgi:hypothetical protein